MCASAVSIQMRNVLSRLATAFVAPQRLQMRRDGLSDVRINSLVKPLARSVLSWSGAARSLAKLCLVSYRPLALMEP